MTGAEALIFLVAAVILMVLLLRLLSGPGEREAEDPGRTPFDPPPAGR